MVASDIIKALRDRAGDCFCTPHCDDCALAYAAADEIERLDSASRAMSKEVDAAHYIEGIEVGQGAMLTFTDKGVRSFFAAKRIIDKISARIIERED